MDLVQIDNRFCGPPRSGNGGYACGLLGRVFPGAATVRLQVPPPLDRPLGLVWEGERLKLLDDAVEVAYAHAADLDCEPPAPPSLGAAREASAAYVGYHSHPFPTCFVCGPERAEGDGLRIFPGRVGNTQVAAPWLPSPDLADAEGRVRAEFMWSALDCTGFFAFAPLPDGAPALLGELTARIDQRPEAGTPCIATGWLIGSEGRKRYAGSAVFSASGERLAVARATWIVRPPGAHGAVV